MGPVPVGGAPGDRLGPRPVTGGSRGIGAATVAALAPAGHDVVVGFRAGHTTGAVLRVAGGL